MMEYNTSEELRSMLRSADQNRADPTTPLRTRGNNNIGNGSASDVNIAELASLIGGIDLTKTVTKDSTNQRAQNEVLFQIDYASQGHKSSLLRSLTLF